MQFLCVNLVLESAFLAKKCPKNPENLVWNLQLLFQFASLPKGTRVLS